MKPVAEMTDSELAAVCANWENPEWRRARNIAMHQAGCKAKRAVSPLWRWLNGESAYWDATQRVAVQWDDPVRAGLAERDRRKTTAEWAAKDAAWQQYKVDRQHQRTMISGWLTLLPSEFESECAELLRTTGYRDVYVTRASGDGGVDVVAVRDGQRYAVQCKRYAGVIDPTDIRALAGVVATDGYAGGIFMTTGVVTQDTRAFAERARLTMYTGQDLVDLASRTTSGPQRQPITIPETLAASADIGSLDLATYASHVFDHTTPQDGCLACADHVRHHTSTVTSDLCPLCTAPAVLESQSTSWPRSISGRRTSRLNVVIGR
jgi:hypothetical protein